MSLSSATSTESECAAGGGDASAAATLSGSTVFGGLSKIGVAESCDLSDEDRTGLTRYPVNPAALSAGRRERSPGVISTMRRAALSRAAAAIFAAASAPTE